MRDQIDPLSSVDAPPPQYLSMKFPSVESGRPKGRAFCSLVEEGRFPGPAEGLLGYDWHGMRQAFQPVRKEHQRLVGGCVLVEGLSQWQPYEYWEEGFAMRKEG